MNDLVLGGPELTIRQKLWQIHWFFVLMLVVVAAVGFAMLYSAAGGNVDPWAKRHALRFGAGIVLMIGVAVVDTRIWLRYAYAFYIAVLLLLVAVDVGGAMGMGARRWINIGFINLQPSEMMKIAMVLALARYFHGGSMEDIRRPTFLIPPILIAAVPAAFVLRQPDLGTSLILLITAAGLFFMAGVRLWKFLLLGVLSLAAMPFAWQYLHSYQRKRVLTFLNPENDPPGPTWTPLCPPQ